MEYQAIAKYIKISPRKVRLVVDALRELPVDAAINALEELNNRASEPILKTIKSAISNAVNNRGADKSGLSIKTINVTEGVRYKRYRYAGRGRIRPYVKRTSHINVILIDNDIKNKKPNIKNEADAKVDTEGKEESK